MAVGPPGNATDEARNLESGVKERLSIIETILERLPRLEHVPDASRRRVFIVYGQDHEAKALVMLFVEHMGLEPVVFDERPTEGRSVIEQLEHLAGNVSYAVVVLTPDDAGGAPSAPTHVSRRARQNVIFELGYFAAKLGRARVCALKRGDVEIPSDYLGVNYVSMDEEKAWHLHVAAEMNAAGLPIDVSRLLS